MSNLDDLHPDHLDDDDFRAGISLPTYERLFKLAREQELELALLRGKVEMLTADVVGLRRVEQAPDTSKVTNPNQPEQTGSGIVPDGETE